MNYNPNYPPRHQPLRDDIQNLADLTAGLLRDQGGEALYELASGDRRAAARRREGEPGAADELRARTAGRAPAQARVLVRAFLAWFQVANVAEKVHRMRRRREYFREQEGRPQPGGVEDALAELKGQGLELREVLALLGELSIEPVLIAHPTESARRTTLRRQQRLADALLERSNPMLAPHERDALLESIRTDITIEWQTAEHPRERLTVSDEREHAVFYLAEVFYRIIPAFYQELASALGKLFGADPMQLELPAIVRFGTWVGGDMDGAAEVHAKSIRESLARQQQVIINNYYGECMELAQRLSQSSSRVGTDPAIERRIAEYRTLLPGTEGLSPARHDPQPYRVLFGQVAERLRTTYDGRPNGYENPAQFRADVALVADSLRAHGGQHAGYQKVKRLLVRIDTFGFHLATLDMRQHAAVHHAVLAQGLDDPLWAQRPAAEQHQRLVAVLERDSGPAAAFDALGRRTLAVFEAVMQARHRYGGESIGLYVVSGATCAADVLAPLVLAHWAGARDRRSGAAAIDVAPQFDSVASLEGSGEAMRELLADAAYQRHLATRDKLQTVVIGYSDSNREGGIIASRLATYRAQRSLTAALRKARDRHVLFHGRGGSIARGGGRIDALLRAAPAESVMGVLRFTEQGESLSQHFGLRANAMRTLERAFGTLALATLAARRGVAVQESAAFAAVAQSAASASHASWRALVHGGTPFYRYFRAATPIDVIERMRIGEHQVRAAPPGVDVDAVPAAAFVYAWSQSRHMLPGWYGAGTGLAAARAERGTETLQRAWAGWPFFRTLIDDIEAMLARTDLGIAACYDELAPIEARGCARTIHDEYRLACELVCEVKGSSELLEGDRTLQRAISLRNPYVDPMNFMQVDLLRRWREGGRRDRELFEALLESVTGIGAGLQTCG